VLNQESLQTKTPEELIALVASLDKKIKQRDAFIELLEQELALAKQRHFGRKSEKAPHDANQYELQFDEAQPPENQAEIIAADEAIAVPAHIRKKPGRKPLPKDLPRTQVIHDLADADKICGCGCTLTQIGQETSEQLDIIPQKVVVIEHIKYKYVCKQCETATTARIAPQPIPKSLASPGTLAYVATAKFCDGLPLYRQEQIFNRMGVDMVRNTLAHWMIRTSELLRPLYLCLQHEITHDDIAYSDETRLQVLKEPDRSAQTPSFMWCFIGGPPEKRSVMYHYNPSRAHTVLEEQLAGFQGYLHCDGYAAYHTFAAEHAVKLQGCWMHARRKFHEITKIVKSSGLAHQAVAIIAKLYKIEKQMKALKLKPDDIQPYRLKHSQPILDKFRQFIEHHKPKVLPKSPLGKAFTYADNQWPHLVRFLEDGRLDIDNGLTERAIKPFVIGRKNFLFCNSVAGARAAEVIYSLIETCKLHQVEPYQYLRDVLTKLPAMTTLEEIETLLPFNIQPPSP